MFGRETIENLLTAASENSSWHTHRTKAAFGEWVSTGLSTEERRRKPVFDIWLLRGFIRSFKKKVTREAESWQDGLE